MTDIVCVLIDNLNAVPAGVEESHRPGALMLANKREGARNMLLCSCLCFGTQRKFRGNSPEVISGHQRKTTAPYYSRTPFGASTNMHVCTEYSLEMRCVSCAVHPSIAAVQHCFCSHCKWRGWLSMRVSYETCSIVSV